MRKHVFVHAKKDADQLPGDHAADQRLCFSYINCKTPIIS